MKLYARSLAQAVLRAPGRRLELAQALKWGADVAKGLVELHRLGVVCADVRQFPAVEIVLSCVAVRRVCGGGDRAVGDRCAWFRPRFAAVAS